VTEFQQQTHSKTAANQNETENSNSGVSEMSLEF
jgi:hypothetical protein